MFLKNLLRSGDFVELVPIGIQLTLQYNESGNLEKVYNGFGSDRADITNSILSTLISNKTVPAKIHITKGTSWVRGVLYTGELLSASGKLPNAVNDSLLKKYFEMPSQFNFFAGTFDSTATHFKGATPIRQCLTIDKFKLLPGKLIPSNFDRKSFEAWVYGEQYPFIAPMITDYILFRKETTRFVSTRLSQFLVSDVVKTVDTNGYIKAKIFKSGSTDYIIVDYSDVIRLNIHKSTLVVLDGDNQIIYAKPTGKVNESQISQLLTCTFCGKVFKSPVSGSVQCQDVHCISRMIPRINQFLSNMKMPMFDTDVISKWISNSDIISIPDLFLLPEYSKLSIETTLSTLLRALVPVSLIQNDSIFMQFSAACTNNIKTFQYYIHHTDGIETDLGISHPDLRKFITWLSDGYNVSDIDTLLETSQIVIKQVDRVFDGPPIFRGKTILITGDFIRGTMLEISGILKSYAANVTTEFSDAIDCVVVGGKGENSDGKSINCAKNLCIPVIEEDRFFAQYEIDSDLRGLSK